MSRKTLSFDEEMASMGCAPLNESATSQAPYNPNLVPREGTLSELFSGWGLGGGNPVPLSEGAHLEDFGLTDNGKSLLERGHAPAQALVESLYGIQAVPSYYLGGGGPPSKQRQEVRSSGTPAPVTQAGAAEDVEESDDEARPNDAIADFFEELEVCCGSYAEYVETVEWIADGTEFVEAIVVTMYDEIAAGLQDVADGEEYAMRLESEDPEEAQKMKELLNGVVRKIKESSQSIVIEVKKAMRGGKIVTLKRTSQADRNKSKVYRRRNKSKIAKKAKANARNTAQVRLKKKNRKKSQRRRGVAEGVAALAARAVYESYTLSPSARAGVVEQAPANLATDLLEAIQALDSPARTRESVENWDALGELAEKLAVNFREHAEQTDSYQYGQVASKMAGLAEVAVQSAQGLREGRLDSHDPHLNARFRECSEAVLSAATVYQALGEAAPKFDSPEHLESEATSRKPRSIDDDF